MKQQKIYSIIIGLVAYIIMGLLHNSVDKNVKLSLY